MAQGHHASAGEENVDCRLCVMVAFHLSLTREMSEKLSTSKCYGVTDVKRHFHFRYAREVLKMNT